MNNSAVIGYMLIAAKLTGLDDDVMEELEANMLRTLDTVSEEEAEEVYRKS